MKRPKTDSFYLVYVAVSVLLLGACTLKKETSKDYEKPNVLWLVCEDQSPYWFSFYGDSTVSLPNLQRLANEGIVYDNAYAPIPVCSPARSSIITGMYPSTLGTHNMRSYNPYRNGLNQESLNIPSYSAVPRDGVKPFTEFLRADGYYCTNNAKEDYNFEKLPSMWDESSQEAHWRKRDPNQPFFSVFNFNVTHESAIWRLGKDSLFVSPEDVPVPPYFPDDPIIRHDLAVNYSNLVRMDRMVGKLLDELEADGLMDNTVIFFYGDHGGPFPRHKRSLYESGTRVPMLVRMPDGKGAGTRSDEMVSFIDLAPSVLSLAGLQAPKVMQGNAFLGPEKSKTSSKYLFATSDRYDEQIDQKRAVRDQRWKYIRNTYPEKPYAIPVTYRLQMPMMQQLVAMKEQGTLKGPETLWMSDTKPPEELYDLENDPWELNNLILDPQFKKEATRLSERLDQWARETNDLGRLDEQKLIKRWRPYGEQQKLQSPYIKRAEDIITLSLSRSDATLIWKEKNQTAWNMYTQPFHVGIGDSVEVQQVRIGYHSAIGRIY